MLCALVLRVQRDMGETGFLLAPSKAFVLDWVIPAVAFVQLLCQCHVHGDTRHSTALRALGVS